MRTRDGGRANFTRPGLAPALIGAAVLTFCASFVNDAGFFAVRLGVTVLALIILVFAAQGGRWIAATVVAAIAVLWNPVLVIPLTGPLWMALQFVGSAVLVAVGILLRVPVREDGRGSAG
ncbi:DUF6804 family protein [Curtobacterium ammoniigenes]|uniref:DUF6804 family protein n=1 Tax=Curtobacterium ammoniigenes TaxID=395387 RepID=UPI0008377F9D|nr:DUF6804 family protein [Curtobacterium ammoniigenes]